ncbi:hypothetical protein BTVI_05537 [Pitangus sulphuratus]|nr:hypothetical protein BTVI_05537 [Pitangus sulphuratus]
MSSACHQVVLLDHWLPPHGMGESNTLQGSLQVLGVCYNVTLEPSLLQPEQQVNVLPVLGITEMDVEYQDAGVGFLGCKCTLLGHVQPLILQHPQVLLSRAALNLFMPQLVLMLGVATTRVQPLALDLVETFEVSQAHFSSYPDPSRWYPILRCVNSTTQLGVVCKLAEGALDTFDVIAEDID